MDTYIEDIAKTVTLRLKAPYTLIFRPSIFEIVNVSGAYVGSISCSNKLATDSCFAGDCPCRARGADHRLRSLWGKLTPAGPASHSARFKAAMVGLVPSIHDGGQVKISLVRPQRMSKMTAY